jgi:heat shock protein HslJ
MSVDVVEQLRSLTRSFDEFVGEVTSDEVMGEHTDDEGRDRRLTQVAAAVIVLALIGGLAALMQLRDAGAPSDGGTLSGAALADALVGRVWVAIDYPLPQLPFMRLSDGDGSTGVELVGSDGCNDQSGPFRLDGNTVAGSQIGSTDVGCSTPRIAGVWDGTTLTVDSGTLTVTDSSGTSTRWLPLDALSPIAPNELVGSYTMGTATITVTPDAVTTDGCERSWTADESTLRFTSSRCDLQGPATFVLLNAPEWSVVGDDQRVVVQIDRRFVRLDRTDADAPARPGLASFLGAIGDRTWVYDAPSTDYPLARRPSLRPPPSWNEAGAQLVAGFDGCNAYALNGSWTASRRRLASRRRSRKRHVDRSRRASHRRSDERVGPVTHTRRPALGGCPRRQRVPVPRHQSGDIRRHDAEPGRRTAGAMGARPRRPPRHQARHGSRWHRRHHVRDVRRELVADRQRVDRRRPRAR